MVMLANGTPIMLRGDWSLMDQDRFAELASTLVDACPQWLAVPAELSEFATEALRRDAHEGFLTSMAQAGVAVPVHAGGNPFACLDWLGAPVSNAALWAAAGYALQDALTAQDLPLNDRARPSLVDVAVLAGLRRSGT